MVDGATVFAAEVQMDRVAEALGLDPLRLRERNALRPGDTMATGQKVGEDASALPVLQEAVKRSDFQRKRRAFRGTNRGIGLSLFFHGAGFTGSGEVWLASKASLELTPDGARVLVGSTEMGQGARTTLAQVVAEALGWPVERVEVAEPDTARVPDSGPTVASRTCMVVGGLLKACAEEMTGRLGGLSPAAYLRRHGPARAPQTSIGNTAFHLDAGYTPLFPFGHGLSYAEFAYANLVLSRSELRIGESLTVRVDVTNRCRVAAVEVVQLYVRDLVGSVTGPVRELKGFRRIRLKPGETATVAFELHSDDLAFFGRNNTLVTEPGEFHLWVGGSSDASLRGGFHVTGPG